LLVLFVPETARHGSVARKAGSSPSFLLSARRRDIYIGVLYSQTPRFSFVR